MDIESLLKSLNANSVEYIIIGASAFPIHGYVRVTMDLDIFIRPTQDNAERALKALRDFGYDVEDISAQDLLKFKLLIRQYIVESDIHPFVAGITFEEAWETKIEGKIGQNQAYFASLSDLIKMKKAAGRPKDLEDLKYLEELHNRGQQS